MRSSIALIAVASASLFTSCATDDGTRPDDMSAAEHQAAATAADAEANRHRAMPDPDIAPTITHPISGASERVWEPDVYSPTRMHDEMAVQQRVLASQHRAAARALESFEEEECAAFPAPTRAACPLLGPVTSTEQVPHGVRLRIAAGVPVAAVAAHARCHVAFARAHGYEGMDACPLYLKGVRVESGEGYVDLLVEDDEVLAELRQRAGGHVSGESE